MVSREFETFSMTSTFTNLSTEERRDSFTNYNYDAELRSRLRLLQARFGHRSKGSNHVAGLPLKVFLKILCTFSQLIYLVVSKLYTVFGILIYLHVIRIQSVLAMRKFLKFHQTFLSSKFLGKSLLLTGLFTKDRSFDRWNVIIPGQREQVNLG
jgi:hypothetical protein